MCYLWHFRGQTVAKKGNRDGWVYLAWSRACRREVQNRNPCVIYGTFAAKEQKKQHESRWLGVFSTLGAESVPSVKNTPCRRDSRMFLLFGHESAVNSTRIAFRDRFLVLSHQACGQSRSKTAPGSPVRGQASRFACFPAVWPRKKSPAYGREVVI